VPSYSAPENVRTWPSSTGTRLKIRLMQFVVAKGSTRVRSTRCSRSTLTRSAARSGWRPRHRLYRDWHLRGWNGLSRFRVDIYAKAPEH